MTIQATLPSPLLEITFSKNLILSKQSYKSLNFKIYLSMAKNVKCIICNRSEKKSSI